jgi:hypothetical protein
VDNTDKDVASKRASLTLAGQRERSAKTADKAARRADREAAEVAKPDSVFI